MDITEVNIPPLKVVGTTKIGKYQDIAKMISAVFGYVMQRGVQPSGPPIYLCHETSAEEAKKAATEGGATLEVALPISGDIETDEEFKLYDIPGGKMAKIIHKGPYKDVGVTYEVLFTWIGQNQKKITGPLREVYISDPTTTAPEEIITEIYAPIE